MPALCRLKKFLRMNGTPAILEEYHSIGFSIAFGCLKKRTPFEYRPAFLNQAVFGFLSSKFKNN